MTLPPCGERRPGESGVGHFENTQGEDFASEVSSDLRGARVRPFNDRASVEFCEAAKWLAPTCPIAASVALCLRSRAALSLATRLAFSNWAMTPSSMVPQTCVQAIKLNSLIGFPNRHPPSDGAQWNRAVGAIAIRHFDDRRRRN